VMVMDIIYRYNPNSTGRIDRYLDKNGNPVRNGSKPSHNYSNQE